MKKRSRETKKELDMAEDREVDAGDEPILDGTSPSDDICKSLLDRYAKSSAPQHRHLCASACAMRSILTEEGLPLTPPAYFAAVITAIRDTEHAEREAVAALSAFLSILLPVVPVRSVPPPKAKDAVLTVISLLQSSPESLATTTVRSLVKSLGFLVLCLDLDDWSAVELPLETLFKFTMDRRPKVRKCAQVSVEKAFSTLRSTTINKKASNFLLSILKHHISLDISEDSRKKSSPKSEHIEALHLLNVVKLVVPNLPKKIVLKFLPDVYKLLGCRFSLFTRHVLTLLEVLLEYLEVDILVCEAEKITSTLSSYISYNKKNPVDTILTAATLLRKVLNLLYPSNRNVCIEVLPLIFSSLVGFLDSKADTAKHAADILVELINRHIDHSLFPVETNRSYNDKTLYSSESKALDSICILLENTLCACSSVPNEHLLAVISELFLKLGELSCFLMGNIVLKLSQWATHMKDLPNQLEECLGSAVVAMGPEKILSMSPISLDEENLTCSNAWLIPVLRKYVSGATLQFFMDHIVPLIKSLQDRSKIVKRSPVHKDLQLCIYSLWDLLPAFCHYAIDTSQNFNALAQLLIVALKEDPSFHETIAKALQVLVNENKSLCGAKQDAENILGDDLQIKFRQFQSCHSKKVASKNIKAMASCSVDLLQTLVDLLFCSPTEKRPHLKEAIECLSSIIENSKVQSFFGLISEKFEFMDAVHESEDSLNNNQLAVGSEQRENLTEKEKMEQQRCAALELASCFIVGADKDLIIKIFDYIRRCLSVKDDGVLHCQAYLTLNRILMEHSWFYSETIDELMETLFNVNSTSDTSVLQSRFSCLRFLMVYLLKSEEEGTKGKSFIILNEIILTLKDSDKDVRKAAYDMLLAITCSLKDPQYTNSESPLHKLLAMIMGYFSGSSPAIASGAVSALSLVIYKDAHLCLSVPNLLPSILALLQKKANEVIKAVLGFVKVLVSCLHAAELNKLVPDISNATLPWSSVSKNHFRTKVRIIFEIMMRKCGADSVNRVIPEKYRGFIKTIEVQRQSRTTSQADGSSNNAPMTVDSSDKGGKKRKHHNAYIPSDDKQIGSSGKRQRHNKRKNNIESMQIDVKGGERRGIDRKDDSMSQAHSRGRSMKKRMQATEKPRGKVRRVKTEPKVKSKHSRPASSR